MFNFRIITLDELEMIQHDSSTPSNHFQWLRSWITVFRELENNQFGFEKEEVVVLGYQNGQLVSVLPLMRLKRRYFGIVSIAFLELLGQQWSSFGNDIILLERPGPGFVHYLMSWLKDNIDYDFLFFTNLPTNTVLRSRFRFFKYDGTPYLSLKEYADYDDFALTKYSRKWRENLRRAKRLAVRDGIRVEEGVESINETNFQEIKRVARSKIEDGKSYLYGHPQKELFYKMLYKKFQSQVVWIKFNGKMVAYSTNFFWKGNKFGLDSSYDRDFRRYNLGAWCMDLSVRDSFERGNQYYSFGSGFDSYKFRFTDTVQTFSMCYDWKPGIKTHLLLPLFRYLLRKKEKSIERLMLKSGYYG